MLTIEAFRRLVVDRTEKAEVLKNQDRSWTVYIGNTPGQYGRILSRHKLKREAKAAAETWSTFHNVMLSAFDEQRDALIAAGHYHEPVD